MSTATRSDGGSVFLQNVSWELYTQLRDDPERDRVRMTYQQGVLELMSPSGPHERINRILERLIGVWCEVHEIPMASFGSTTYRSERRRLGLEPDSCFYFENEAAVRGHEEIDLTIQPPPDLAIEVDISSSSTRRMSIYAGLGVPEVWRTDGEGLWMFHLDESGEYVEIAESQALARLRPEDLTSFLAKRLELDDTTLGRQFRERVLSGENK